MVVTSLFADRAWPGDGDHLNSRQWSDGAAFGPTQPTPFNQIVYEKGNS